MLLLKKIILFIDAESEQIWIAKSEQIWIATSETFNLGFKIGFLLLLTRKKLFYS